MKIVNFGSCNIDYVYSLDHIVAVGETETTNKMEIFPGGKGLNQSIAAARAGAKIYHAGCVGEDGDMLLEILKDSGVDVSFVEKVNEKNGHAIIQVTKRGENSIFLFPGSNNMVSKEYIDRVLENFEKDDILLLQNEISNIEYITDSAYSKGMKIILNPSPCSENIFSLDLSKLYCLVLNEVEASQITGESNPEKSLIYFSEKYPDLKIMLTLGSDGCIFKDGGKEIYQPSFDVTAVDTTAAGDTFTGYFIAGISRGEEYAEVLKKASSAAAISVTVKGAAPSVPRLEEVEKRLPDMKVKKKNKFAGITADIEEYVAQNISDGSIRGLAGKLGYSLSHTAVLVKQITGKSFSEYMRDKRCSLAAELLKSEDISVKEVIRAVGYENESYFRRLFRKKYGVNPLVFRKREEK